MSTSLRSYTRGYDQVSVRVESQDRYYFGYDHQGTTQCLTDQSGEVSSRFACDAWGTTVTQAESGINRNWYIGNWGYYQEDADLGDSVRQRSYVPNLGSMLSADYVDELPYAYVGNNPASRIDPSGLIWITTGHCWIYTIKSRGSCNLYPRPRTKDKALATWPTDNYYKYEDKCTKDCENRETTCFGQSSGFWDMSGQANQIADQKMLVSFDAFVGTCRGLGMGPGMAFVSGALGGLTGASLVSFLNLPRPIGKYPYAPNNRDLNCAGTWTVDFKQIKCKTWVDWIDLDSWWCWY